MEKTAVIRRLNIIRGQIGGLVTMIENEEDCEKILVQLKAIHHAFASSQAVMLKTYLLECLPGQDKKQTGKIERLLDSLTKN